MRGRSGSVGGAKFEDEARAGGRVIFCADGAVVFLQNFGGDGEAEAGAALLGGEVGEEEALAHLVGEAGAGVGDDELDHAGGERAGGDVELAEQAVLHGFGGVVDEVGEGALEGFGVGDDEREVGGEVADDADVAEAAGEEGERVFDDGVEVGGAGAGGGKLGERGELVDQRAHGFDGGGDDFGGALNDGGGGGLDAVLGEEGDEAGDVALDEFGVERDGGERIFDLVGDAAGDFFPGALLLRAEEFGGVFEDEDVAEMLAVGASKSRAPGRVADGFEQGDGRGEVQDAGAGLHLHLGGGGAHAMSAAEEVIEGVDDVCGKDVGEGEADEVALAAGVEHLGEGAVGEHDAAVGGEGDDAGGDGFDDGFELGAAGLQGVR